MLHRYEAGEFSYADSIHFDESLKAYTLQKHRLVYGGGGIMPDIFVPIDTTAYSKYYRNLVAKGVLNKFAITYVDNHRDELKKQYKTDELFAEDFNMTDEMLRSVVEIGQQEGVEYVDEDFMKSKEAICRIAKGLIARDIFDMTAYFRIVNPMNPVFRKALETIDDTKSYHKTLK